MQMTHTHAHLHSLNQKLHLSAKESAQYLGISERSVRDRAYSREIPSFKMGRRLLFRRSDLDAYVDALVKSRA